MQRILIKGVLFLRPVIIFLFLFSYAQSAYSTHQNKENSQTTPNDTTVTLIFGVYTSDKPTTMVKKFRPLLNDLEDHLTQILKKNVEITMQVAHGYEKGIEDIVLGNVDFSRLGPASYIEAKQKNPKLRILAIESKNGRKTFNGLICVHRDSFIQTVADLKGKSFAFGNKRSTIGRYLSQAYLLKHGIKAKDLKRYEYLDRHDKVGTAIGLKQFNAGALKEGTFKRLLARGTPIRKIASFHNVTKPWVARSGLPKQILDALHQALLELKDPAVLKALGKDGFLGGSDKDYDIIRKAINNNPAFFTGSG